MQIDDDRTDIVIQGLVAISRSACLHCISLANSPLEEIVKDDFEQHDHQYLYVAMV